MPDRYEELYPDFYGTSTSPTGTEFISSDWSTPVEATTAIQLDPARLFVTQEFGVQDVEITWDPVAMVGATQVAGFRRSGTDTSPFTPTPETELFRVSVGTQFYLDEDVPPGDYVYQVFPLVES